MSGRDLLGIFNLLLVAGVVAAVSYFALTLRPAEYDTDTLCIAGETPPHRVVIIDKTDLYSTQQAAAIERIILTQRDTLAVGERLSLFELDETGRLDDTNQFSLCNPGSGDQVNPLYRNPDRIQARYEALFDAPLQQALADLVVPKDAPQSPILEALAELAQEPSMAQTVPGRRIVLVSDMLQNSDIVSVYGRARGDVFDRLPPVAETVQSIRQEYGMALAGITLEIHLIERPGWESEQNGDQRSYWTQVFSQLGMAVSWQVLPADTYS
ncbi:hypothetical protein HXX25_03390 [Hyphobacterium sp. CCMP332]|uniref:hypothetical protein n=1 Tax=Hyphobacterium sp. CCMP332 TaxID=2749086 RepID=UPI00164F7BC8|nr:hypothetical protein [Hyphobacterium sp. CCMP332]QNL18463.1 hypothetical protein HXX25_03390 [Hyphobacterium sp. CCMP332]